MEDPAPCSTLEDFVEPNVKIQPKPKSNKKEKKNKRPDAQVMVMHF